MHLQRHDWAWLAREFEPQRGVCDQRLADAARTWIAAGRPFVVANQQGIDRSQVRLGFTLPGVDVRQRVGLVLPRAALVRIERALALHDAIDRAPPEWRAVMRAVEYLSVRCGVMPRVFGSLSAQLASGEPCLKPSSDLDLLFECDAHSRLDDLLVGLHELEGNSPRVDGELLLTNGWAVAWRELDRAMRAGGSVKVLARSAHDLRLMPVAQLFTCAQAA